MHIASRSRFSLLLFVALLVVVLLLTAASAALAREMAAANQAISAEVLELLDSSTPAHLSAPDADPPVIDVTPPAIEETLASGASQTTMLTISNTGGLTLTWSLSATARVNSAAVAIALPQWLAFQPAGGATPPGQSSSVTVTLDAVGLISATYLADLFVLSNDPALPTVTAPVTMHVIGEPLALFTPDRLSFGQVFVGYPQAQQLLVENIGTADLVVSGIAASDPNLSVAPASFVITPLSSGQVVTVTYAPLAPQPLTATLTISTNQPVTPVLTMAVLAQAVDPPILTADPAAFDETMPVGATRQVTLTIGNAGGGTMTWAITPQGGGGAGSNVGIVGLRSSSLYPQLSGDPYLSGHYTFTNLGNGWTYATIDPYDIILVDETDRGVTDAEAAALRTFYDAGGSIVLGMTDVDNLSTIARNHLYYIFGVTNARDATFSFGSVSNHPIAENVAAIGGVGSGNNYFDENGARWVVRGSDGYNYVLAYEGAARSVIMGERLDLWYSASPQLVRNAIDWMGLGWLSAAPLGGATPAGLTASVAVTLDATSLITGAYYADLLVESNSPLTPQVTVPVNLRVQGEPAAVVTPGALDFGQVFVGYSHTLTLLIENVGTADLLVADSTTSDPALSLSDTAFTLPIGESRVVSVTYAPTLAQPLTATLAITTNQPLTPVVTVAVVGAALDPPVIEFNPTAIAETLAVGETRNVMLAISNTGGSDLNWEVAVTTEAEYDFLVIDHGQSKDHLADYTYQTISESAFASLALADMLSYQAIYFEPNWSNYTNLRNNMANLAEYVRRGGVAVINIAGNAGSANDIDPLGTDYNHSFTHDNEIINLPDHGYITGQPYDGYALVTSDFDNWGSTDNGYLQNYPAKSEVVLLNSHGASWIRYRLGGGNVVLTTLTYGWGPRRTSPTHHNLTAYANYLAEGWLDVEPDSGVLAAGASAQVTVTLDASGLTGAAYLADLSITSNDPARPQVAMPVTLQVGGDPLAVVAPDLLDFGQVFTGYTHTLTLAVENGGASDLRVFDIVASDPALAAAPNDFVIPPLSSGQVVTVTYAPAAPQVLTATLTITTNDPLTPVHTVPVLAVAGSPPVIDVAPTAIEETLASGASRNLTLTISNTGGLDLLWQISAVHRAPAAINNGLIDVGVLGNGSDPLRTTLAGDSALADRYRFTDLGDNWSYATIQPYQLLLIDEAERGIISDAEAAALRTFYDAGGSIVLGMHDVDTLSLAAQSHLYYIFGVTFAGDNAFQFGSVSDHPIGEGVVAIADMDGDNDHFDENGAEWVVRGDDGHNYVLAHSGRARTVIMGQYFRAWYAASRQLVRNAIDWAAVAWLTVNPDTGVTPPGSAQAVPVALDATRLISGAYLADLLITSNDPATSVLTRPVTMHVTGQPMAVVTPTLLDFGQVFLGYAPTLQFEVANEGTAGLRVFDIVASDPALAATPNDFVIPPLSSGQVVIVTYAPVAPQVLTATLTITSNDPVTPVLTVAVLGAAADVPIMGVDPTAFDVVQDTGLVTTRTLLVENDGLGILDFDLSVTNGVVSVDPISGTLVGPGHVPITVTFDTTTRPAGVYQGEIRVSSNDPVTPLLSVPVTFTVILVPPEEPASPSPQAGEINVRIDKTLAWQAAPHATAYDLYLWPVGQPKPGVPTAADLPAAGYDPPANLPTGTTFHWQVVARNVAGDTAGAEWTFTTETLPDLVVTTVNTPPTAFSGQPAEFSWVVTNVGARGTTTSVWHDRFYIATSPTFDPQSAIYLGQTNNPAHLGVGESYLQTTSFNLSQDAAGDYYAFVVTDYGNLMREASEADNTGRSAGSFGITLTPPPDLQVTALSGPANALSGDAVQVTWQVQNAGPGPSVSTAWSDRIYLSANEEFDADQDFNLKTVSHSGALAAGESYTATTTVNLPQAIYGDYYLFLATDIDNQVYEHAAEENNVGGPSDPIAIILSPPPDLEVTSLAAPAAANSGATIDVAWEVANYGAGAPFETYWQDRVYLATSPLFTTTGATVLGTLGHSGALQPGQSYTASRDFTLPNGIAGQYYVYVWTDYDNQVFEFTADDNNTAVSNPMAVSLAPSPDLQVSQVFTLTAGSVAAGSPLPIGWVVRNAAAATPATLWHDRVYLSTSATWPGYSTELGTFERPQALAAGASYTQTRTVIVPSGLAAGDYYLYVLTDVNNAIYEHQTEDNNVGRSAAPLPITRPPAAQPTDLVLGGLSAPSSGSSGQPITIGWMVTNTGQTATQATSWWDALYLSADTTLNTAQDTQLGAWLRSGALAAGAAYARSETASLPNGIEGQRYVFFVADLYGQVNDDDRSNNVDYVATPLSITLSLSPDLQARPVNPMADAVSGQPLAVAWSVINQGAAAATGAWYDALYFSADPVPDAADKQLTSRLHSGGLAAGQAYTQSVSVNIPSGAAGAYYLVVQADSRNDLYEHTAEANNVTAWSITVTVPPPADLVVISVTVPASAIPGDPLTIDWRLRNQGAWPASGYLCDAVFISADAAWDIGDARLGDDCRTIDLAPGETETLSLQALMPERDVLAALSGDLTDDLPGVTPGQYYAIVRADILNHIRESDETNNAGASVDTIAVDVEALTLGEPASGVLGAGQSRFYRVDVPAGETLLISLDSASATAANELYVRYGQTPSRGAFDYGYSEPFAPDQEVVVPTTEAGVYYILVYGASAPGGAQPFSLTASLLEFELRSIDITAGGQGGPVTVKLAGAQFTPDTRVFLERDEEAHEAANVYFEDASTLYATLDLSAVPYGNYDVVVRYEESHPYITATIFSEVPIGDDLLLLPDDPTVVTVTDSWEDRLPAAFDVVSPTAHQIEIRRRTPSALRPGQPFLFSIEYSNRSNNDIAAPLLLAYGDPNIRMSLPGDSELAYGEKRVMALASSGPAGILRPGSVEVVTMQAVAPGFSTVLRLDVDPIRETSEIFDFNAILRDAGVNPNSPAWGAAVAQFAGRLDGTWQAYEAQLATYANQQWGYDTLAVNGDQLLLSLLADLASDRAAAAADGQPLTGQETLGWDGDSWRDYLDALQNLPASCEEWRIDLYRTQLHTVAADFPANASDLLNKYLDGPAGNVTFGVGHPLSQAAQGDADYRSLHSSTEPQAKSRIEQQIKAGAASIADFAPPGPFAQPKLDVTEDLKYSINGTQGTTAAVVNIELDEQEKEACEAGSKTVSYQATVRYTIMDNYNFTLQDANKPGLLGYFGGLAYYLEQCGETYPYQTFVIIEEEIAGEVQVDNPGAGGEDCDSPDDDDGDGTDVSVFRPRDPNDIIGPAGYGDAHWMAADSTFGYTIRYENDPQLTTTPAQRVYITQTLDSDLDARTFRLGAFSFGKHFFEPPGNRSFHQERLGPLVITTTLPTTQTFEVYVDVNAGIDVVSGQAFWILQTIDPQTGAPPSDAAVGFLPPDVSEGDGQGFVSYLVKPQRTAQTGDLVDAVARIYFDDNDAIDTPPIFNTLDAGPPTSVMDPLPPATSGDEATLAWSGQDDGGGSGFHGVDLYVSMDGEPFVLAQANLTDMAAVFIGLPGHTYGFFALAQDNAGNWEPAKSAAEAATLLYLPGEPTQMAISADPASLPADGSSASTITATVRDALGDAVVDATVTFTATLGALDALTATTDAAGLATTTLTAGFRPGTATVTAVSGPVSAAAVVELLAIAPAALTVAGPPEGVTEVGYTFTATVSPITATLPITYLWQATEQAPIVHVGELSHGAVFTWTLPSAKAITVTASNVGGALAASHVIVVFPLNKPPLAANDAYLTVEDTPLTVTAPGVLANDNDPNADSLTALLDSEPDSGELVLAADGSFVYTPTLNFHGADSFTYHANDGELDSNVATVAITVKAPFELTGVAPEEGSHGAALAETVSATFDQPLDLSSVTTGSFALHGTQSRGLFTGASYSLSDGDLTVNLAHSPFVPGEALQATLTTDIQSANGYTLAEPHVWQFRAAVTGGGGSFVDSDQELGSSNSYAVALGDVEGDGDLDAFVGNGVANKVWLNDGSGFFASGQSLGSSYSQGVALGDVDGDGDLDAFVANEGANRVWLNDDDSNGGFSDSGQSLGDSDSQGVALGDVDGDGDLDAFVANWDALNQVWLNDGSGFFTSGQSLDNSASYAVALGDVDGDGDLDAFVGNDHQSDRVWLNDGSGFFSDSGQPLGSSFSRGVALGDVDGDGDLDAFVANEYQEGNQVWLNNGSGGFSDSGQPLGTSYSRDVALGDVDGDGDLDAFVANKNANQVWLNDGSGGFTSDQSLGSSNSYAVALGDVDGDGDLDVFVGNGGANRVWFNNNPPLAVGESYTTTEDTPLTVAAPGVLANDTDADGDALTAILAGEPLSGTLALAADGSFVYTPTLNFNGVDSFTYQAFDGVDASDVATVTIEVAPANDPPLATGDAYTATEDTPLTVAAPGLLTNDSDVEGDALTAVLDSGPASGELALAAGGSFVYTPTLNFAGLDSFTYQAFDGVDSSNVATVTIAVAPVNDPPLATGDSYTTTEDIPLAVAGPGVLANDTDPDGDALAAIVAGEPLSGTLALAADGSFVYTPTLDFRGLDSFTYQANDGQFDSNTATVTITVTPANDAPLAANDAYTTTENIPLAVTAPGLLANDTDADGDALATILAGEPLSGTLALAADGSFVYTPTLDFTGVATFTYQAFDGVDASNVATVAIEVQAPLELTGVAPANGSHGAALDETVSATFNQPLDLSSVVTGSFALHGTQSRGLFTGAGYSLSDGDLTVNLVHSPFVPGEALQATLTTDIQSVNGQNLTGPHVWQFRAAAPGGAGSFVDSGQNLGSSDSRGVALGDVDGDGDLDAFVANAAYPYANRVWLNDGSGLFSDSGQELDDDSASYAVALGDVDGDGDLDAFVANWDALNRVWLNDGNGGFTSGQSLDNSASNAVALGDVDGDGDLDAFVGNENGNQVWLNDGSGGFSDSGQPLGNSNSYAVALGDVDGDGDLDAFVANWDAPNQVWLNDGSGFFTSGQSLGSSKNWSVALGDVDGDGDLDAFVANWDAPNQVWLNDGSGFFTSGQSLGSSFSRGVALGDVDGDGDLDAFVANWIAPNRVWLNDGSGFFSGNGQSLGSSKSWSVALGDVDGDGRLDAFVGNGGANRVWLNDNAPAATDDSYNMAEDTFLAVAAPGVLGNDTDADGDALTAILASEPLSGTLALAADGGFVYTPTLNFHGLDSFTYHANDGQADSNTATVTITVAPVNDPPLATGDAYTATEDTPLAVAAPGVLANDDDIDGDVLAAILDSEPLSGTLALAAGGGFVYTPTLNFHGLDSFTYHASDGQFDSNTVTVTITVAAVNDAPLAADDSYATTEDIPLTVAAPAVLGNDSDVDGDALAALLASEPLSGTLALAADGSFAYTPTLNFNGLDSFTYQANDGELDSNTATVTIEVTPANDAPLAAGDAYTTVEETPLTVAAPGVLANDTDPEGDALAALLASEPLNGVLVLAADGSFVYTPTLNFAGLDSFTYHANDGQANSNTATVTITVTPVNDAPLAASDAYTTTEDKTLYVLTPGGVLGNDSDPDGDVLTALLASGPLSGTLWLSPSGGFIYTPDANFNGVDRFSYRASDGITNSLVATATITVTPVNDPPLAADDSYVTLRDTPLPVAAPGVLANDSDADDDPLTAIVAGEPLSGTLALAADGSFVYTPTLGFAGVDSFTYYASDGQADSNTALVAITVKAANQPPVAVSNAYTATENKKLTVAAPGVLGNDTDPDGDGLTAVLDSEPVGGVLTLASNGGLSYMPPLDFTGVVSFTYHANDGLLDSNVAPVVITVEAELCPIEFAAADQPTSRGLLPLLRQFRDEGLTAHPATETLVTRYYQHAPEVVRLLLLDGDLRARTLESVQRLRPAVQGLLDDSPAWRYVVISNRDLAAADALLADIGAQGSAELRAATEAVRDLLRQFRGRPVSAAWQRILAP